MRKTAVKEFACHLIVAATVALSGLSPVVLADSGRPASAAVDAPLQVDPVDVIGTFPNGLRYVIRHNANPAGKVFLNLAVRSGSLNETDAQNGIAHFLEHMAFKGSTHFPPSKLIPLLTHLGMQFGADANAFTTPYDTVFKLAMPDISPAGIRLALQIFADDADGLALYPIQIASERRVILEEIRVRDTLQGRFDHAENAALFPNSRMSIHDVLGDRPTLDTLQRDAFVDYWNTWYRPEKMTLVVVGDIDPAAVIVAAEPLLGHFTARAPARAVQSAGIGALPNEVAVVLSDPEQVTADVTLVCVQPARPAMTTESQYRHQLVETMGQWMIDRRLRIRANRVGSSLESARIWSGDVLRGGFMFRLSARAEPKDWASVLDRLIASVRVVKERGFSGNELQMARDAAVSAADKGVAADFSRDSASVVSSLAASIDTDQPLLSAKSRRELIFKFLSNISADDIQRSLVDNFDRAKMAYVIKLPAPTDSTALPARQAVLSAAHASWNRPLMLRPRSTTTQPASPPTAPPATMPSDYTAWLPTDFLAGTVISRHAEAAAGVTTVEFANGVVMHHRFSDARRDQVLVRLTLPGGILEETPANHGISVAANVAFTRPCTKSASSFRIRNLLAERSIAFHGSIGLDSLQITLGATRADLPAGLSVARAVLTDGNVDPQALLQCKRVELQALRQRPSRSDAQLEEATWSTVFNADPRLAALSEVEINRQQASSAGAWLHHMTDHAAIEVAVVGDIGLQQAIDLIGKFVGSLPQRTGGFADLDPLRTAKRAAGPYVRRIDYKTAEPKAVVTAGFIGCDMEDAIRRPLTLASLILSDRMVHRLRFDEQLVYSIASVSAPATTILGTGMLTASSTTDPQNADRLCDEILDEYRRFAASGPSDDELDTARMQMVNRLKMQQSDPSFWLSQLAEMRYARHSIAGIERLPAIYQAVSREQVRDAVKQCVADDRMIRLMVMPANIESPSSKPANVATH